jgi:pyruvate carboxylase subunit B
MAKKSERARTTAVRGNLRLTDTTFGDAQQAVLGGRLRGAEVFPVARKLDGAGLSAIEAFGAATFQSQLEAGEDPWEYLRGLREAAPNTALVAVLRGQALVGTHGVADDAVELFIRATANLGADVFRVLDPLNDLRNLEVAVGAARRAGRRVQGCLCYTVSPVHDLERWRRLAGGLAALEVDDLVIEDDAGLLAPQAARQLVAALAEVGLPVLVHSHCAAGLASMAYLAAVEAGAAGLDVALSPFAWGPSQPAAESVAAALAGGERDAGVDLGRLLEVRPELEELRRRHAGDGGPGGERAGADVLRHGLPASLLEDLRRELDQHHAEERLDEALMEVGRVREELGYPPLVTPVRQLVASQAVYNLLGEERYLTVTQELKEYLQGLYGSPPGEVSTEVRQLVLGSDRPITVRPADLLQPQLREARERLRRHEHPEGDGPLLSYLLFPAQAAELFRRQLQAGEAAEEEAEEEEVAEEVESPNGAVPPDAQGPSAEAAQQAASPVARTAEYEVEVEGEVFRVRVSGAGMTVAPAAGPAPAPATPAGGAAPAPAAAARAPREGAVVAPMQGLIVKVPVKVGDEVALGQVIAVLEAMKMQNDIVATRPGKVAEVYVREGEVVTPNQPLVAVA